MCTHTDGSVLEQLRVRCVGSRAVLGLSVKVKEKAKACALRQPAPGFGGEIEPGRSSSVSPPGAGTVVKGLSREGNKTLPNVH